MTAQKKFKQRIRARMERTGESYSTARAALVALEAMAIAARSELPTAAHRAGPEVSVDFNGPVDTQVERDSDLEEVDGSAGAAERDDGSLRGEVGADGVAIDWYAEGGAARAADVAVGSISHGGRIAQRPARRIGPEEERHQKAGIAAAERAMELTKEAGRAIAEGRIADALRLSAEVAKLGGEAIAHGRDADAAKRRSEGS